MIMIISSIPFTWWGLDIIDPSPPSIAHARFIFITVDYFTKWVEAQAFAKITQDIVVKFIYRSIVCHFGVPHHIITDNGSQFTKGKFSRMCKNPRIHLNFSSMYQSQGNDKVEVIKKSIVRGLKKSPTGHTPLTMTYGVEAVVPIKMSIPTPKVSKYDATTNDKNLSTTMEKHDEIHDEVELHNEKYKMC